MNKPLMNCGKTALAISIIAGFFAIGFVAFWLFSRIANLFGLKGIC